jgi:hypothetical protein
MFDFIIKIVIFNLWIICLLGDLLCLIVLLGFFFIIIGMSLSGFTHLVILQV